MEQQQPRPLVLADRTYLEEFQREITSLANTYSCDATLDLAFLVFLRKASRLGYFTAGPVTIDVRLVEDLVERTAVRTNDPPGQHPYGDDYVRFTRVLMDEVRRSGRTRLDDLHLLLAFMRVNEGMPARVFGEFGVSPEQMERYLRGEATVSTREERLYSPEEAATYLGVHVQTIRAWIRAGRLPARRLAGQRALRIRASDLEGILEPLDPSDDDLR
jgi:excisionase family DNA binding protein